MIEPLAFRIGVISPAGIKDCKNYYDRTSLQTLLDDALLVARHRHFQVDMNNRLQAYSSMDSA